MDGISEISFEDFVRCDLRVAEITEVEEIKGADKLYKLKIDVGELGESKSEISSGSPKKSSQRTICAGIKQYYSKEELIGKKIIYLSNLKPRVMKGIESQGMLLAASTENHSEVVLISPEKDIENGVRIG